MTALSSAVPRRRAPDADADDPVRTLLGLAQRLTPDWRDQRRFFENKSELIYGLRQLLDAGGAPAPPRSRPIAPVPAWPLAVPTRPPTPALPTAPAAPLTLSLPRARYLLLVELATAPGRPRQRRRAGYDFQSRTRAWCDAIDEKDRTVTLSAADVAWVRKQIAARGHGGFQGRIAAVFAGVHPYFTNIPALPRRRRSQQKRRVGQSGGTVAVTGSASAAA